MKVHGIATEHSSVDEDELEELIREIDPDIVYTEGDPVEVESFLDDAEVLQILGDQVDFINDRFDEISYGVEDVKRLHENEDFEVYISSEANTGLKLWESGYDVGFLESVNRKNNLVYDILTFFLNQEREDRGEKMGGSSLPNPSISHSNLRLPRSATHKEVNNVFDRMSDHKASVEDVVDHLRPHIFEMKSEEEKRVGLEPDGEKLLEMALRQEEEEFVEYLEARLTEKYPELPLEVPEFNIDVLEDAIQGDIYDGDLPFRDYHCMRDKNWFDYIRETAEEDDEIVVVAGASHLIPTPYERENWNDVPENVFSLRDWFEHEDYDLELYSFFRR